MRNLTLCMTACVVLGVSSMAHAALPTLPGFGKKSDVVSTKPAKGNSLFHTPPVFTKMSSGTKRLMHNTKSLFTPDKPPAKTQGVVATKKANQPQAPQQSFFGRMFNPQPTAPPRTIGEWMKLDQPHPSSKR